MNLLYKKIFIISTVLVIFYLTKSNSEASKINRSNCAYLKKLLTYSLNAHNNYRALHRSLPLELNEQLSNFAQEWSNKIANDNDAHHRPNNEYGENIFSIDGPLNGFDIVKSWYDEIQYYDFNNGGYSKKTGHFTQVVWKNSAKLGVGCAISSTGATFVVANYYPTGNVIGQFNENVLKEY